MHCLYNLRYVGLKELVEKRLNLKYWSVRDDELSHRTDSIVNSERFRLLKERAVEKKLNFNDIEIVTWLDSLYILYYAFENIKDEHLRDEIHILQEYCIPYSWKRSDYLLVYDNKILILEFSFNKLGYNLQYETKLQQAIGYKELLANILSKDIDIGTHTFILSLFDVKLWEIVHSVFNSSFLFNHKKIFSKNVIQ